MKHAGKTVPQSKCAACHKGTGTGGGAQAQHSATVTKGRVCSACHTQKLHATARVRHYQAAARCHKGALPRQAEDAGQIGVHALPHDGQPARGRLSVLHSATAA